MKKMFPDYSENIVNDDEMKSIFNVLTTAGEQGYKNVNIIVGSDRQSEFENLGNQSIMVTCMTLIRFVLSLLV